jgi:hypothetical protein
MQVAGSGRNERGARQLDPRLADQVTKRQRQRGHVADHHQATHAAGKVAGQVALVAKVNQSTRRPLIPIDSNAFKRGGKCAAFVGVPADCLLSMGPPSDDLAE